MSIENDQTPTVVTAPSPRPEAVLERARNNPPRWNGTQHVTGMYAIAGPPPEGWPQHVAAIEIVLFRGQVRRLGWDGQEIWVEPDKAAELGVGEACALLLLQKTGAVGGIKPKKSFFALLEKAAPHLDSVHGGVFASSYGALRCVELDGLCYRHQALMTRQNLRKGVVVVLGFPESTTDEQIKALLDGEILSYFRFPSKSNLGGMASAQLEYDRAKANCTKSEAAWNSGTPLRLGGMPVRIEWGKNQGAFDRKPAVKRRK